MTTENYTDWKDRKFVKWPQIGIMNPDDWFRQDQLSGKWKGPRDAAAQQYQLYRSLCDAIGAGSLSMGGAFMPPLESSDQIAEIQRIASRLGIPVVDVDVDHANQ